MKHCFTLLFFYGNLLFLPALYAQDAPFIRMQIDSLCSERFQGRGYVNDGVNKAGDYLAKQFADAGLKPFGAEGYFQYFTFSVNTFPGEMKLKYRHKRAKPGVDYLLDAYSPGQQHTKRKTKVLCLDHIATEADWTAFVQTLNDKSRAYVLNGVDSMQKRLSWRARQVAASLPEGIFIFPKKSKPLWWPGTAVNRASVVYWFDTSVTIRNNRRFMLHAEQLFIPQMTCKNVIGMVSGELADSYIVFTAHYDHLGMMGKKTMFPGASDNASGTAMILSLAQYFAQHPSKYTMVFMAFAGEEAGLIGSEYFAKNPLLDLKSIRFLINIDIMGDAENGIAVVNGVRHEQEFELLNSLNPLVSVQGNDTVFQFKEIRKGEGAANSDHYHFTEAGVPSFFIFSMGGKGFYHDIWDKPETLSLKNIPAVRQLVIDFVEKISEEN